MSKKKTTAADAQLDPLVDEQQLQESHQALTQHAKNLAQIDQQFPSDLPYSLDLYIARIRQLAAETGVRLVEMGNLLIQIREREPAADYAAALERIGIAPRYAARAIQVAVRFGADMQRKQLAAQLGASKVLELVVEDDDDLAALADGGTLAGHTADELAALTVRELRELLRKERAQRQDEKQADAEIIARKDERINNLMREQRKTGRSSAHDQALELLAEMDRLAVQASADLLQLRQLAEEIEHLFDEAGELRPAEVIERIDTNRRTAADWARVLAGDLGE